MSPQKFLVKRIVLCGTWGQIGLRTHGKVKLTVDPPEEKILNKPFNYLNLFESKAPKHLRAAVPAEVLKKKMQQFGTRHTSPDPKSII